MNHTFGNLLRLLRCEQHLTQSQVAQYLGISRQAYSYYERSSAIPGMELLSQLSDLYHFPLQTLCNGLSAHASDTTILQENSSYQFQPPKQADTYSEFLDFFSKHDNMKKYHHLSLSEKKLLFTFQRLSTTDQEEVLHFARFKFSRNTP